MGRFGPDPLSFFKAVYAAAAPWEIGAPQSAMISLIERYPPASPALDLGCASGDLAIHLALLGCEVHGVDFVERAIEQAHSKLTALPPDVANRLTFSVADAMRPSALGTTFSSIFDSGFLHLLDERESEVLVEELGNALRVGGRYYLHAFAVEFPIDNVPRALHVSNGSENDSAQSRHTSAATCTRVDGRHPRAHRCHACRASRAGFTDVACTASCDKCGTSVDPRIRDV